MVVCKYFLQGSCKFGSNCHNEHQAPSSYTSFGSHSSQSPILRQANFGSNPNPKSSAANVNIDVNALIKSVVNDMTGAEKGGQWLLSCYAPFKEKPALPGFEDQSPEEIRLGFYEAQKNGTIDQYKSQLQSLLQDSMMKIKALQNPTQDVVVVLQNIYSTPPSSCSGTYGQNVITQTTGSLNQQTSYSFPTQNASSFGQRNENIFKSNNSSNSTNIFGGGGAQSSPNNWPQPSGQSVLFGNVPPTVSPNQNIFGGNQGGNNTWGKTETNIFNSQAGNNNVFVSQAQTPNNSSNIFGSNSLTGTNQQPASIFGSSLAVPPNQNLFANQNMNTQPLLGQQPQPNIFALQNQSQSIQPQNIFSSQNQKPQNIFNINTNVTPFTNPQTTGHSTLSNYSASIFGSTVNSNPSINFGSQIQQEVDESLYSKLEELNEEQRKWFESDTLDIMNIPDKPPTYDMCFKT